MPILSTIFSVLYVIIIAVVIILVIADNSPAPNKLAWILILTAFPLVGLVLYFLIGFSLRAKWKFEKRHELSLKVFSGQGSEALADLLNGDSRDLVDKKWRPLVNLLSGPMSRAHVGNSFEIITSGERKLELLLRDIEAARHSIHVEYFHFGNDESSRKIKELLMRKAREGVEVRFIYERLANFPVPTGYYYEMKKAGVQIVRYKGPSGGLLSHVSTLNYRDHRKIMLIDGKIGYTGGMNLNKNYFHRWKDTHLRIMGRSVASLQAIFLDGWFGNGGTISSPLVNYFPMLTHEAEPLFDEDREGVFHGKTMMVVPDEPDSSYPVTLFGYEWIIHNAQKYIYFQSPYFVPPDSILNALKSASLRGVDVRLMVPRKVDTPLMAAANRSYFQECFSAGVRVFEREGEFIHSKTVVCDDGLLLIGTSNIDNRSFELNFEDNAFIFDPESTIYYKEMFLKELDVCTEVTPRRWGQRKWYNKLAERFMRLFSPLL